MEKMKFYQKRLNKQPTEFGQATMNNQPEEKNSMLNVLSLRDFRLLFAGVSTSLLGDQFALIATPWLVLQLTGDPLALGLVLALGPSTPLSPVMFDYGVHLLSGSVVEDIDTVLQAVSQGANFR